MKAEACMRRAIALAKKAKPSPNPRVGAVLVREKEVIGEGYHKKRGLPHAEIEAFRSIADKKLLEGATLYVTLEPCCHTKKLTPPCTDAITESGIKKVFVAMLDPNPQVSGKGVEILRENGIDVDVGMLEEEARSVNRGYIKWIKTGVPFVLLKMAATADGKTAAPDKSSKWVSSDESRNLVKQWRSEFDAVMVGAETARQDNPSLLAFPDSEHNPYRIIVTSSLSLPDSLRILNYNDGKTIIATAEDAPAEKKELISEEAKFLHCGKGRVDMKILMNKLGEMGITSVLLEGGSELAGSAVEEKVVDEVAFFISPKIMGGRDSKPVIGGAGLGTMSDALPLKDMNLRKIGIDYLLTAKLG